MSKDQLAGESFVSAETDIDVIISVYISPNRGIKHFEGVLEELLEEVKKTAPKRIIIMEDFNPKNKLWGDKVTEKRGEIRME